MALVVGTFTYCVVVLRSVRSALGQAGRPIIPNISVAVAVVLGIGTILAVVAFINHSAHTMDVSEILQRVRRETIELVRRNWSPPRPGAETYAPIDVIAEPNAVIRFDRTGWVEQLDTAQLLGCVPDGGVLRVDTYPGRFAIEGTPLCTIFPTPAAADLDSVARRIRSAAIVGPTRTMQEDVAYGLRQLADVAIKALSPGINDPTTAQDAIFQTAAVLRELLLRDPPPQRLVGDRGGRLLLSAAPDHTELVQLAFAQTRRAAAEHPAVTAYILEALGRLEESVQAAGRRQRAAALRDEARFAVAASDAADLLEHDRRVVHEAYERWFIE